MYFNSSSTEAKLKESILEGGVLTPDQHTTLIKMAGLMKMTYIEPLYDRYTNLLDSISGK